MPLKSLLCRCWIIRDWSSRRSLLGIYKRLSGGDPALGRYRSEKSTGSHTIRTSSSNPSAIQATNPMTPPPMPSIDRSEDEVGSPQILLPWARAFSMPPGPQRRQALHRLASRWGRIDPQAALRWSEDLTGRDQFSTMEDILRHWSDEDPAAAADYVTRLPGSEHTLHLLRDLSHRWAESDRGSALEWSMALEDPALRMRAIRGVASSWAEHDPAGAAASRPTRLKPSMSDTMF